MEVDKDDVLKEDDVIGSPPVVEKRINSSCNVDDESDSPHDDLSDGVTLAAADSTTPEVDTCFREVHIVIVEHWYVVGCICRILCLPARALFM